MKNRVIEHILSIALVSAVLLTVLFSLDRIGGKDENKPPAPIADYVNLSFVDYDNPFHQALMLDVMDIYFPGKHDRNAEIVSQAQLFQRGALARSLQNSHLQEKLTPRKFGSLTGMYLKFLLVYVLVMGLTYYGVQTIGVWRFVRRKQRVYTPDTGKSPGAADALRRIGLTLIKGIAAFALFCPAYVIAYSIKTEFATDSIFFLVLLGVVSNGLLIMYSNRFYTFLIAESRKGYVETAVAKNLNNSYDHNSAGGIPLKAILKPVKQFNGHVFDHIFRNARLQYFPSIKEQASFLITGLIITEMALNIHGYLNYEMLRQILYGNWDVVIVILLGIFYTVKGTEIVVDVLKHRELMKYENKSA